MLARQAWILIVLSFSGVLLASDADILHRWDFELPGDTEGWTLQHDGENLAVADGVMRFDITGPDAFVVSPMIDLPLDGTAIRVRMRCDQPGSTQVYWTTSDYPAFGEQCVLTRFIPARTMETADGLIDERFDIGRTADAQRTLTSFRIDACNGNSSGRVEIDAIELLRLPPMLSVSLAARSMQVDVNEPVELAVSVRHVGGRQPIGNSSVSWSSGDLDPMPIHMDGTSRAAHVVTFDRPGVHNTGAILFGPDAEQSHSLTTSVIVGDGKRLPLEVLLRTERYRLDAVPVADARETGFGAIRWQLRTHANTWTTVGWLMPLCRVILENEAGVRESIEPALALVSPASDTDRIELRGQIASDGHCPVTVTLESKTSGEMETVQVTVIVTPKNGIRLLHLSGPVLRVSPPDATDPLDRYGLFGGIEFLTPGWRSSSPDAVGEQFADRWTPHPIKVALPVMAIEAERLTRAMLWNPLQKWDGSHEMPMATFASPNFIDEQNNHLMALSVPNTPGWCDENDSVARRAYKMADQSIEVRFHLHAEMDLPVALTARRWYELFQTPPHPPTPHSDARYHEIIAQNYGQTMYWERENGWRHHWYHLETTSSFVPFMASELIGHAATTGNTKWIALTNIADQTIIDSAGTLASRIKPSDHVRRLISSMRPDGTWPFTTSKDARDLVLRISNGRYDSLGEEGSTSLGTCVQPALTILKYALLTGDNEATQVGLRALKAMRQFRVPRGAQVWEVHQQVPDIRAAALAVEAFHLGYRISGDRQWLGDAHYWAWTGVPFIYSWHVPIERRRGQFVSGRSQDDPNRASMPLSEPFEMPDRQVTPYGTLPVLGTSCYVVNWFGVLVQWCGMEWAWKVIELDADRPDPLLRYIADGVVASGLQQMFDRAPWTGLYPDWWNLEANIASGALINAMLPLRCLQAQGRLPKHASEWTQVLRDGWRTWHVSGWGDPVELDPPTSSGPWSAKVRFAAGQPNELVIVGVDEPRRITVEGRPLEQAPQDPTRPGWSYMPDYRAIAIRFDQTADINHLRIGW